MSKRNPFPCLSAATMLRTAAFACMCALAGHGCVSSRNSIMDDLADSRRAAGQNWSRDITRGEDAQEALAIGELSLQDALRLAMKHNKALQAAFQDREIARGGVLESYATALPMLSAGGDYTRLDEVTSLEVNGQRVSFGVIDNYSVNLTVTQPIVHGAAIPAAMQAAKLFALFSDEKIRGVVEATVFNVARCYFDALLAERLLEVKREAAATSARYLDDVRKKKQQGMSSEYNVLRAQVELSNLNAELISQQNESHMTATELLRAVGISQVSEVVLSDDLVYAPLTPNLEEALRAAAERRPDIYQAELSVRMQKQALRIARSDFWPRLDAFFRQEWASPAPRQVASDEWGDSWTAGASVSLPIFDGFMRYGRLVQEKARLRQSEAKLVDAEELAFLEVKQAVVNVEDAEAFLHSQRMNMEHAREGLRLIQAGYKEGVNTEVEVMDGQTALTRAQALYYQAIHAHAVARLYLQKAMGLLAPEPGVRDIPTEPEDPRNEKLFPAAAGGR